MRNRNERDEHGRRVTVRGIMHISGEFPSSLGDATENSKKVVIGAQAGSALFGGPISAVFLATLTRSPESREFLNRFGVGWESTAPLLQNYIDQERKEDPSVLEQLLQHTRRLAEGRGVVILGEMDLLRGVATYGGSIAFEMLHNLLPDPQLKSLFYVSLGVEQAGLSNPKGN